MQQALSHDYPAKTSRNHIREGNEVVEIKPPPDQDQNSISPPPSSKETFSSLAASFLSQIFPRRYLSKPSPMSNKNKFAEKKLSPDLELDFLFPPSGIQPNNLSDEFKAVLQNYMLHLSSSTKQQLSSSLESEPSLHTKPDNCNESPITFLTCTKFVE